MDTQKYSHLPSLPHLSLFFVSFSCAFPYLLTSLSRFLSSPPSQSAPLPFHFFLHLPSFPLSSTHSPLLSPYTSQHPQTGGSLFFPSCVSTFIRSLYSSIHSFFPFVPYFISFHIFVTVLLYPIFVPLFLFLSSPLHLPVLSLIITWGIGLRWLTEPFG